jgi:predicted Rossmann-fold nucleotide-binding protein
MVITGAGPGIMQAGHEGAGREKSFGVNIRLPSLQLANRFIRDDPKLMNFHFFFTRKLLFVKEADAVVIFPGGFGTQDELFESITLVQTGKSQVLPIILMDLPDGTILVALAAVSPRRRDEPWLYRRKRIEPG